MVRISFATVSVNEGKDPTAVIEFTVVVDPAVFTLIVGVETEPDGVKDPVALFLNARLPRPD